MVEDYIEKLRPYLIKIFLNDSSGHDINHLERTMKLALYLQEKEGGDRIVIGIAAFLHDIHRVMQNERGCFVSPKDSLDTVKEILSNVDLKKEQIDKICYAIEYHELYNWNGNNVNDINALIVQDADNLDAIGAIGIARTFTYSGCHNVPMYKEEIPIDINNKYIEGKNSASTIHHFYDKLLKQGNYMNTATARKIAKERTKYMEDFVKEFIKEWKAEF